MEEEKGFVVPEFDPSGLGDLSIGDDVPEEKPKDEDKPEVEEEEEIEIEPLTLEEDNEEEPEKEPKEKKPAEKPSSKGIDSSSRKSASRTLAKALYEEGILSDFDDEEFDEKEGLQGVFDLVTKELDKRAQNYVSGLDTNLKEIADAIDSGVDLQQYKKIKSSEAQLNKVTDEHLEADVELRKSVIRAYYKETSPLWSDAMIEKKINQSVDIDEDLEEAKAMKADLLKFRKEQAKDLQAQATQTQSQLRKDAEKRLSNIKSQVEDTAELIPGIKISKQERSTLYKTLTEVVDTVQDKSGKDIPLTAVMANRAKNPVQWDLITAYFHQLGLYKFNTEGSWKPDFSKLTKSSKSKAIKELESVLTDESLKQTKASTGYSGKEQFESDLDSLPTFGKAGRNF